MFQSRSSLFFLFKNDCYMKMLGPFIAIGYGRGPVSPRFCCTCFGGHRWEAFPKGLFFDRGTLFHCCKSLSLTSQLRIDSSTVLTMTSLFKSTYLWLDWRESGIFLSKKEKKGFKISGFPCSNEGTMFVCDASTIEWGFQYKLVTAWFNIYQCLRQSSDRFRCADGVFVTVLAQH